MKFKRSKTLLLLTDFQHREEMADQFALVPTKGGPPQVNICPPSPQNNEDIKTGNFS